MWLIDRYVARRFLANFLLLLILLFTFAVSIDLLLEFDEYVEAADRKLGPGAGWLTRTLTLVAVIVNFHGPRIFQFYAYMLGLLSVGAMGFTLAQMHRHKELVALLASGVRLQRVAMPIIVVAFGLNILQLLNQEFLLPKLAPMLIRRHGDIGKEGLDAFAVGFTADGRGNLLLAPSFDPKTATLTLPTFLERDDAGRTVRRITADSARWDPAGNAWDLTGGRAMRPPAEGEGRTTAMFAGEPIEQYATDLSPEVLTIRHDGQFATMLSLTQIREMLGSPGVVDSAALVRYAFARFTTVFINILVLVMTLPFFLLREPASLLRNSMLCAGTATPAMMGALLAFAMEIPGIPPAAGVFLPVLVMIPLAMFMVTLIRT